MPLDLPSVSLAIIFMSLVVSMLMIAYSRGIKPRMPEINSVAIALLLLVAGSLILLLDVLPASIGIVIGNFFILEAYIVIRMGFFFFQGRKIRWPLINGVMILIPLWFAVFTFVVPLYAARCFFFDGSILVICVWTIHSLAPDRDPGLASVRKMAISLLATSALVSLVRLVWLFAPGAGGWEVGDSEWDTAVIALQGCFLCALSFTLILMRTERLNALARTKQAAVEESLQEKETLLREIHHRVKNNLQVIISLINLRLGASEDEAARKSLQDIERKVRAMALVHERLYESPSLSRVGMRAYLSSLVSAYHDSFDLEETSIEYRVEADDMDLPIEMAMPIGLIVGELITNCQKHAFPGRSRGQVRVSLVKVDSWLRLVVADDGIGLLPEAVASPDKHLGHLLVRSLADQLGGELSIDSREGLSVMVDRIPFGV